MVARERAIDYLHAQMPVDEAAVRRRRRSRSRLAGRGIGLLDAAEQSGSATPRPCECSCEPRGIHADRDVWALITSCPEAMTMIPGLIACNVMETAPDQSWQRIRHVMNYSWYVPTVTYEIRASYEKPAHVVSSSAFRGICGFCAAPGICRARAITPLAHYKVDLAPGFWVPRWVVHAALKRDLPKMLRALRSRAEAVQDSRH
jgi:hypothetical protein